MGSVAVVYDQDISTLNGPDGIVIAVQDASTADPLVPASIGAVAFVGTATRGPFDAVQSLGDARTGLRTFGPQTVAPTDLMTYSNAAFSLGVTDVRGVRIGDGTQSAGVLPLMAANGAFMALIFKDPGSFLNGATQIFTYSPLTPSNMLQTSGNAQRVLVDCTIQLPDGDSETYQNLDGNIAVVAGGVTSYTIDPVALYSATAAAINNGQANGSSASGNFIAAGAASQNPGAPIIGVTNVVTSFGTDGADFGPGSPLTLDAAMLGSTATSPGTGMYAFGKKLFGAALSLCGCTDVTTIAGPMYAYARAYNGRAYCSFPDGTISSSAITVKNLLGVVGDVLEYFKDFVEIIDSTNGAIHRFVDPSPFAAARAAITPPHISPANQSMFGVIVGTRRTGSQNIQPYDDPETTSLENAGINFFSDDTAANCGFAIRHNKNSLGKTAGTRGNTAYSRNKQYYIATYQTTLLGAVVGQDQGFASADDKQRAKARSVYHDFLDAEQIAGRIDSYRVVCDLTNNRPGLGQLRVDTFINQNEIIDRLAVGLVTGVGVVSGVQAVETA